MEVAVTTERIPREYLLTCRRCGREWTAAYEVLAYHDLDGDHELHYLHGVPAMPPWANIVCSNCGGQRVKVLPSHGQASSA
jgi:hypothetical protein